MRTKIIFQTEVMDADGTTKPDGTDREIYVRHLAYPLEVPDDKKAKLDEMHDALCGEFLHRIMAIMDLTEEKFHALVAFETLDDGHHSAH